MEAEENQINSIITKAEELGLIFQINENNKWMIYLKNHWTLAQIGSDWVLNIQDFEIYMFNSDVLSFLESGKNTYL